MKLDRIFQYTLKLPTTPQELNQHPTLTKPKDKATKAIGRAQVKGREEREQHDQQLRIQLNMIDVTLRLEQSAR